MPRRKFTEMLSSHQTTAKALRGPCNVVLRNKAGQELCPHNLCLTPSSDNTLRASNEIICKFGRITTTMRRHPILAGPYFPCDGSANFHDQSYHHGRPCLHSHMNAMMSALITSSEAPTHVLPETKQRLWMSMVLYGLPWFS